MMCSISLFCVLVVFLIKECSPTRTVSHGNEDAFRRTKQHFTPEETGFQENQVHSKGTRGKRSLDIYEQLARASGGTVYRTNKGGIVDLVEVINDAAKASPVLMKKFKWPPHGNISYVSLYVDDEIQEFTLTCEGSVSTPVVGLTRPDGTQEPFSDANATQKDLGGTLTRVQIQYPIRGEWKISRGSASNQWDARIEGQSTFTFSYKFVEVVPSTGLVYPITGRPLAGVNSTLVVDITGVEHVQTVESVKLYSRDGIEIINGNRTVEQGAGRASNLFRVQLTLPTQEFQIGISGLDQSGNRFERLSASYEQALAIKLEVFGIDDLYPGESVDIPYKLTNLGGSGNFVVKISDDKNFVQAPLEITYTGLANGASVNDSFVLIGGLIKGETATVTVSAEESGAGKGSQYQIRRLTVNERTLREVDNDPPSCNITKISDACTAEQQNLCACQNFTWSMEVEVRDDGFGLYTITSTVSQNGTFVFDHFTPGESSRGSTITANVSSDCCDPFVTINAADMAGNVGQCVTGFPVPPSPALPVTCTPPVVTTEVLPTVSSTYIYTTTNRINEPLQKSTIFAIVGVSTALLVCGAIAVRVAIALHIRKTNSRRIRESELPPVDNKTTSM